MNRVVEPGRARGTLNAIPSKSQAHRLLIAAALSAGDSRIRCGALSDDILYTAHCLQALCAQVRRTPEGFHVAPRPTAEQAELDCGESGSTYRFMLPVAAALGCEAVFLLRGRLPQRPMDALFDCLEKNGVRIEGKGTERVRITGRLRGGTWQVAGDISSQFITGLLLAAPLTGEECRIELTSPLVSGDYVAITLAAMQAYGITVRHTADGFLVPGGQAYAAPGSQTVEGDWSNAAFWLCLAAAGKGDVTVAGLREDSPQGDKAILTILQQYGAGVTAGDVGIRMQGDVLTACAVDIGETPDLAPAIALLALAAKGESEMRSISRLRLKESDRAQAIVETIQNLGGTARVDGDSLFITGGQALAGGTVSSWGDHRIAMMGACAAALCTGPVTIRGAEAVSKSYPGFFDDLRALGISTREEA